MAVSQELPAVPDLYGQFMAPILQQQQMQLQQQQAGQQAQAFKLQLAQAAQQQQAAQQYQTDAQSVLSNPTPEGFRALMLKYPQMHEGVQSAFQNYSDTEQQRITGIASSVYSALSKGDPDSAASALTDYSAALKNAGMDTSVADNALKLIQSGDPAKVKQAQGMAGMILMNAYGPDKGPDILKALSPDGKDGFTLKGADGAEYRYAADGSLVAVGGMAKDDGSTPAPAAGNAGVQGAINHVLGLEGGYNPKDANGSPTNFGINYKANAGVLKAMGITPANFKDMTKDQAAQVYASKYWPASGAANLPANLQAPYFDVYIRNPALAKAALAKSGGDPQKFVEISNQMFAPFLAKHPQYTSSYQQRFNSNMAIASGQSQAPLLPSDTQNPAPPGFHWIGGAPGIGKPPEGYEADPAHPGTLKPIPGGPADTSTDAMDDGTVNFYAQEILAGTPMSQLAFGMGKAAAQNRRQVMEKVAQLAGAEGLSGRDLAVQIAHYKAGMKNVSNLETQLGAVQGNELTFAKNASQVAQLASQLSGQTNYRALNTPVQTYLRQTGDPTIAKLDVAIKTAANEYARLVTASPTGTGTLTDSARDEYQNVIQGNFPVQQKLAALQQMAIDARNRSSSLRENLQGAYSHLTDRAPELMGRGGGGQLPAGATKTATGPNGQKAALVNGKWVKY